MVRLFDKKKDVLSHELKYYYNKAKALNFCTKMFPKFMLPDGKFYLFFWKKVSFLPDTT